MEKKKAEDCFSTFSWLIYREVEKYVNEHENDYEEWERTRTTVVSNKINKQVESRKTA